MSRHEIPKALALELSKRADPECPDCSGEGYVTFTASNSHGYTEVRCACVGHADEPRDEPL